jgi:teichoic acid transport system permease protein
MTDRRNIPAVPDGDVSARAGAAAAPITPQASSTELAALYGLTPSAARPSLELYLRQLWQRRHFLLAFSRARVISSYSQARLGQLWQLLTPLMLAGVYLLLFGLLLRTDRGVENFIAFLVTGVFVFSFTQRSVISGSESVSTNLGLVRALHFPRATLPLAYTVAELQQLAFALVALGVIVLLTGEPLTAAWLLVPVVVLLQCLFNAGAALIAARVGAQVRDVRQVLPFVLRTWLYLSGVFFSIQAFTADAPVLLRVLMSVNPTAVYIDLVRTSLLVEHDPLPYVWPLAVGWAVVSLIGGFLYFWRAEERYGRG